MERHYSTYCGINGLLGFVVAKLDINATMAHINTLAKTKINCNMIKEIRKECFIPHYEYHYSSQHKDHENNVFTLYHLMLDYSSNIETSAKDHRKKTVANSRSTRTIP